MTDSQQDKEDINNNNNNISESPDMEFDESENDRLESEYQEFLRVEHWPSTNSSVIGGRSLFDGFVYPFDSEDIQNRLKSLAIDAILTNNINSCCYIIKNIQIKHLKDVFLQSIKYGTYDCVKAVYSELSVRFGNSDNLDKIYRRADADEIVRLLITGDRYDLLSLLRGIIIEHIDILLWHPDSDKISDYLINNPLVINKIIKNPADAITSYLTIIASSFNTDVDDIINNSARLFDERHKYRALFNKKTGHLNNILSVIPVSDRIDAANRVGRDFNGILYNYYKRLKNTNKIINYCILAPLCNYGLLNPGLIKNNPEGLDLISPRLGYGFDYSDKKPIGPQLIYLYERYVLKTESAAYIKASDDSSKKSGKKRL